MDWSQPVNVDRMEVYWFDDQGGVRLPVACRLKYWDGTAFAPVSGASGLGIGSQPLQYNHIPGGHHGQTPPGI